MTKLAYNVFFNLSSHTVRLLQTPPSQLSSPNQGLVAPSLAIRSTAQQTVVSHTPEAQILLDIPVKKEEPSDTDTACTLKNDNKKNPCKLYFTYVQLFFSPWLLSIFNVYFYLHMQAKWAYV